MAPVRPPPDPNNTHTRKENELNHWTPTVLLLLPYESLQPVAHPIRSLVVTRSPSADAPIQHFASTAATLRLVSSACPSAFAGMRAGRNTVGQAVAHGHARRAISPIIPARHRPETPGRWPHVTGPSCRPRRCRCRRDKGAPIGEVKKWGKVNRQQIGWLFNGAATNSTPNKRGDAERSNLTGGGGTASAWASATWSTTATQRKPLQRVKTARVDSVPACVRTATTTAFSGMRNMFITAERWSAPPSAHGIKRDGGGGMKARGRERE